MLKLDCEKQVHRTRKSRSISCQARTDKALNSSKTCRMKKNILVKETALGRLTASESIQQEQREGGILLRVPIHIYLPK